MGDLPRGNGIGGAWEALSVGKVCGLKTDLPQSGFAPEDGIPSRVACPPPDEGRPLKKVPFFYACENGVFKRPSEILDSIVGFSILRGLICEG